MARLVHVIDVDFRRRAQIAHDLGTRNVHAEIYDSLEEFGETKPGGGFVFSADDETNWSPEDLSQILQANGIIMPFVVYSNAPTTDKVVSAMLSGALDYLEWPFDFPRLDLAFRRMAKNGEVLHDRARRRLAAREKVGHLSLREREVLHHIVGGLSNKQIADVLRISPRTVEIHRSNLMHKLNAQSAADIARIALYAGLDEHY
jgi:FixJ family two-component response regulator